MGHLVRMTEKIEVGPNQQNLEEICDLILNLSKGIRYVEIAMRNKTFTKSRSGLENILTQEETKNSIIDALDRWETRKKLAHKLGPPVYALAEYRNVKRITFPLSDKGLMLVTMDPEGFHEVIIKEIIEIKDMVDWNL